MSGTVAERAAAQDAALAGDTSGSSACEWGEAPDISVAVALLDARLPEWPYLVDLDCLNLDDPFLCLLGQLFGEYVAGLEALGILGMGAGAGFDGEDTRALRDEWRRVIEARRAGAR